MKPKGKVEVLAILHSNYWEVWEGSGRRESVSLRGSTSSPEYDAKREECKRCEGSEEGVKQSY